MVRDRIPFAPASERHSFTMTVAYRMRAGLVAIVTGAEPLLAEPASCGNSVVEKKPVASLLENPF